MPCSRNYLSNTHLVIPHTQCSTGCILLTWDKHSRAKTLAKDITIAKNLIYQVNATSLIIPAGIFNSIPTALLLF